MRGYNVGHVEWSSMTCVDVELPVVVWSGCWRGKARLGRCVSDEASQQGQNEIGEYLLKVVLG